jgi:hypothetical protein
MLSRRETGLLIPSRPDCGHTRCLSHVGTDAFWQTCVRRPPIRLSSVLSPASSQRFKGRSDSDEKHVPFNVLTFVSRTSSSKGLVQQCQLGNFIRFHQ